ncbi:caspase-1-A-like isoform X3 [Huso huso]|uniref:Caspase-1-A-like isoform X3 n=1 Tax=Huso huso TaxID=61971 RepID=A0ABR0Y0C3_HUSHU
MIACCVSGERLKALCCCILSAGLMMACCVSGERLKAVRTRLIEGLNASVIRDLLDDMLHMNVLNDGEVESVKEGQTCTKDKASCLIDMVRKKGTSASEKFINKLAERDPVLYVTLGLHRQSVD